MSASTLPVDLLASVVAHLDLVEAVKCKLVCHHFKDAFGIVVQGCTECDAKRLGLGGARANPADGEASTSETSIAAGPAEARANELFALTLRHLTALQVLSIRDSSVRDGMMSAIGGLPQLRTLDCASCVHIGERGVQLLCAAAPTRLRAVDFSFCPHVGYGCVVALRRACPAIELVRRQPAWMDGAVSTPWGETHTYYADGAFEFTRSEEAVGWVAQTCDRGSHVEDRLLYVDITQSWAHNGRIGVLLKRMDDRRLLVVQSTFMPEPPLRFPELPDELMPAEGACNRLGARAGNLLVSCMRTEPLPEGQLMPPPRLAARLERFWEQQAQERITYERRAFDSMYKYIGGRERLTTTLEQLVAIVNQEAPLATVPVEFGISNIESDSGEEGTELSDDS